MKRQRITPAYKARRVQRERHAVFAASIRAICSENLALAERIRSLQVESTRSAERASIAAGGSAVIFNLIDRDAPVIDRCLSRNPAVAGSHEQQPLSSLPEATCRSEEQGQ